MTETATEQAIQAKGLNAPRLTPANIDAVIVSETFTTMPSGKCLICELTLTNGFTVRGEASAVSKENFNVEIGKDISRKKARDQIWLIEGYLLQQRLHDRLPNIARVCHEINRAYCASIGDNSQPAWADAPEWQRQSIRLQQDEPLNVNGGNFVAWMPYQVGQAAKTEKAEADLAAAKA